MAFQLGPTGQVEPFFQMGPESLQELPLLLHLPWLPIALQVFLYASPHSASLPPLLSAATPPASFPKITKPGPA